MGARLTRWKERLKGVGGWFGRAYQFIDETLGEYSKDRGDLVAAALAFYTMLSIAPLIIIAVAIAGLVLGRQAARQEVVALMTSTMGAKAAETVNGWVQEASASGGVASVVGFVLLLYTASRLLAQLRVALNQVWNVDVYQAEGFKASATDFLKRRLFAFLLVLASGPILLVVVASHALLSGLSGALFSSSPVEGTIVQVGQFVFSVVLVAIVSGVVFKVVPDTRIGWKAVLRGAVLTSVLFNVGSWLVGLYLGHATVTQTYGAAASAVVVLLWLYFSAQIFLAGAEFTQVYAKHFGRGLTPKEQQQHSRARAAGERAAKRRGGRRDDGQQSAGDRPGSHPPDGGA